LANACLFYDKSSKVLHYFGLDCGMLKFFKYSQAGIKEQLLTLPHFWSLVWRQDRGLCLYNLSAEVGD
jgi:hypothetical protein